MTSPLLKNIVQLVSDGVAPGGAIALITDGKRESSAYGTFAGSGSSTVRVDTVYDVASITKLFTAALIKQLHEQGKVSIYDRCALYLDNFHGSELTLLDLLTHRANFGIRLSDYRLQFPDSDALKQALLQLEPPANAAPTITYANLE